MTAIPKEALEEYIGETRDMCERVSLGLGLVEKKNHDDETLNSIYRDVHSIKGGSHLFGFKLIGQLAHAMETALDPVRHKTISLNSELVDALYAGLDIVSRMLETIIVTGEESQDCKPQVNAIVQKIADLTLEAIGAASNLKIGSESQQSPRAISRTVSTDSEQDAIRRELEKALRMMKSQNPPHAVSESGERKDSNYQKEDHSTDTSTIRIPVGLLDNLMNLVGELVLVRNQMLQFSHQSAGADFQKLSQRLNLVTSELQSDVMKTRMQPIGLFLTKFHRVVRDTARDLGKKIEIRIEGADTELDKTLIEAVKDPLTHLVRNSVDHGIEMPEERQKIGKSPTGSILIRSYHEGGHIIIEVADDGPGISPVKIAKKAVDKGIVTNEQLAKMSTREIRSLIFLPGFSTADAVTDISGRGVGMDVVKTNIEKIGGTIDLESTLGVGTTVRLNIPLTLAIIPALLVKASGERFAVPQVKVVELIRIDESHLGGHVHWLQGQPMVRLRGELLPIVGLGGVLKCKVAPGSENASLPRNIVVLRSDGLTFGLAVDEVIDCVDIVVKPLVQTIKALDAYSAATVMGDGSVILILDVGGLSRLGRISSSAKEAPKFGPSAGIQTKMPPESTEYLVTNLGIPGRFAIPLCLVNRLEEFSASDVQYAGEQSVVRYRDVLLPIIPVAQRLELPGLDKFDLMGNGRFSVIVVSKMNRIFGLMVKSIVDVITVDANIDAEISDRAGILGSLIHGKDVVVILDALGIIDDCISRLTGTMVSASKSLNHSRNRVTIPSQLATSDAENRRKLKVLLAEDTSFFRRHVTSYLQAQGYDVVAVINGEEAFKRLEIADPSEFALVLTDIEMPIMDGFELARKIRSRPEYAELPVVALTTRFRDSDLEKGRDVGFTSYLEKFNGDTLTQTMDHLFGLKNAV